MQQLHCFNALFNEGGVVSVVHIFGLIGRSANRDVFIGFAASKLLHSISFVETLDEETGKGYQRRFSRKHSLDFRKYVQKENSSTIPLTFNLRPSASNEWKLLENDTGLTVLEISSNTQKVLSQVDCQHRLGCLSDLEIPLPFMFFIGLSIKEEMEVFNIINAKAKGLSASLLDYHDAHLTHDLAKVRPELFIALHLNNDKTSPWHKQLDLGGDATSGMQRKASFRTIQKSVKRFLAQTHILDECSPIAVAKIVEEFWVAISVVLEEQWSQPRKHFITKGIGVYALMGLAGDFVNEYRGRMSSCNSFVFCGLLSDFVHDVDWTNNGPLKGLGGESGAQEALNYLRKTRQKKQLKVVN